MRCGEIDRHQGREEGEWGLERRASGAREASEWGAREGRWRVSEGELEGEREGSEARGEWWEWEEGCERASGGRVVRRGVGESRSESRAR